MLSGVEGGGKNSAGFLGREAKRQADTSSLSEFALSVLIPFAWLVYGILVTPLLFPNDAPATDRLVWIVFLVVGVLLIAFHACVWYRSRPKGSDVLSLIVQNTKLEDEIDRLKIIVDETQKQLGLSIKD